MDLTPVDEQVLDHWLDSTRFREPGNWTPPRWDEILSDLERTSRLMNRDSDMPRFSIVVPAYNAEATLAETLDAILAQKYGDWECIVVDDGSIDRTAAVAREYAARNPRVRAISQENQGTAGAYNTGVKAAAGEFIVLCSADDLLLPEHLVAMSELVDSNPDYGIYSSNGVYLHESGVRKRVYTGPDWRVRRSLSLPEVLGCCFFSVGATYRRGVFYAVGGYRPNVYGEDYDFWLRAMAAGTKHLYTPQVLSVHRVSSSQKSADLLRVYQSNIEVYQHLLDAQLVCGDQIPQVEAAIVARKRLMDTVEADAAREQHWDSVRHHLGRVLGRRGARLAVRALSGVGRRVPDWRRRA